MKIILHNLKKLSNIILTYVEQLGFDKIYTDVDFYWHIRLKDGGKKEKPDILPVGSLVDDLEWLKKVLNKENISTTLDFERLGSIIKTIGHEVYRFMNNSKPNNQATVPINIENVKNLCKIILTKMEKASFKEIEIDIDSYLCISSDEAYNFTKIPKPIVKSLVDSCKKLEEILNNKRQPTPTDFERLGITIEAIGNAIDKSNNKIFWLTAEE